MRTYATSEDLTEWTGKAAPVNAAGLLRSASTLVEQATRNAIYTVTAEGLPLGVTAVAFRDATCAQAAYWAANGIDPATTALTELSVKIATSKSIKGAAVSYDAADAAKAKQAKIDAATSLCGESVHILDNAGLITAAIQ